MTEMPSRPIETSTERSPALSPGKRLRQAHAAARPLVSPLAHDALSAKLIERAGFKAFNIGGSSLLAAHYALPDLGLAGLGEMVSAMRDVVGSVDIPALVDADDGYGDVKSVVRTVRTLERIGVAGLLLEDQDRVVKQPEANAARSVSTLAEFSEKLRAALDTRSDPDLVIIARTDALGAHGLDEALRRAEHSLRLGADGVFIAGLKTPEQYERAGSALRGAWNAVAVFEGAQTTAPTPQSFYEMGFSQVVYPAALIHRVVRTIEATLHHMLQLAAGDRLALADSLDELSPTGFREAVGLAQWQALENKF